MPVLEVKTIEPAALSPNGACVYLSLSKRSLSTLIADGVLIAKRSGGRTLVDFQSVKNYYASLPVKTVGASIPNAPQSIGASKPSARRAGRRCGNEWPLVKGSPRAGDRTLRNLRFSFRGRQHPQGICQPPGEASRGAPSYRPRRVARDHGRSAGGLAPRRRRIGYRV